MQFSIHNNGAWSGNVEDKHYFDENLAKEILMVLTEQKIKNCVDLGCGMGSYAKFLNNNDIKCDCFDGNPETLTLTSGLCKTLDLSNEFDLNTQYDCVISLEVGEHIPEECEKIFIQNITKHIGQLLILSWAIPGQVGNGHVNLKSNDYIISTINKYGLKHNERLSERLRKSSQLWWFKNTIMVFEK
jgi:cyclopropane fatty-acyl-phospholipid synthase-like methyltransferase